MGAPHPTSSDGDPVPDLPASSPLPDLPSPTATRLAPPRWRDARLLLGVFMVLLSVVLGARIFAEADERIQVWSVTRDLGADTALERHDLRVRSVRLDAVASRYVAATEDVADLVLRRPISAGELLPVAAVSNGGSAAQRQVVIEVDRLVATGLSKGKVVDVYCVRDGENGAPAVRPELLLSGVTVADDANDASGALGGGGSTAALTLWVGDSQVPNVIDAVAHGSVYVVLVPGGSAANALDEAGPRVGAS
jgi:hypothetical protein